METREWKRGKSKLCSITNVGIVWLTHISWYDALREFSDIIRQLRSPKTREAFRKANTERFSRNMMIVKNLFIQGALKNDRSIVKLPIGLDRTDPDKLFRQAFKELLELYLYLMPAGDKASGETERSIENDYVLFAPRMRFVFSWHPGKFPELENEIRKVDNYFRNQLQQTSRMEENKTVSKESRWLDLDRVDEKYYDEYLKARDEVGRERVLRKIEEIVGWSVGEKLSRILDKAGKEQDIDKLIGEIEQPSLRKFILIFKR